MIRIAYFGLPLGALLLVADGHALSAIVLSPPDAPGRRRLARTARCRVLDARDFEEDRAGFDEEVLRALTERPPDLVVSWYWTRRIPERVLAVPSLGAIGVHPSLLPRHRGPNPFFAAIDAGDAVTGVTVHRLTAEYDEGDVLAERELVVGDRNAWQLARALDRPALAELRRVVTLFSEGKPPPGVPQDPARVTLAPEPEGHLLRVEWTWTAARVIRRIRALSPAPGLALEIRGTKLFVTEARETAEYPRALAPGEAAWTAEGVVVRTGDGAILVTRAQIEDGAEEDVEEVRGVAIAAQCGLAPIEGGRARQ